MGISLKGGLLFATNLEPFRWVAIIWGGDFLGSEGVFILDALGTNTIVFRSAAFLNAVEVHVILQLQSLLAG